MRVVIAETLLTRLAGTVDSNLSQHLPTPYLRSQSIAIASLLRNLAERMEEKAELLAPGNTEMRSILAEALAILRDSKEARTIGVSTEKTLDMVLASLIDENAALRRSLYQAIETLYRWESKLDGERLAALRSRIRKYLRRQLDQDLAVYRPVRAGRMAKGA